jgi:hypothetical protein
MPTIIHSMTNHILIPGEHNPSKLEKFNEEMIYQTATYIGGIQRLSFTSRKRNNN